MNAPITSEFGRRLALAALVLAMVGASVGLVATALSSAEAPWKITGEAQAATPAPPQEPVRSVLVDTRPGVIALRAPGAQERVRVAWRRAAPGAAGSANRPGA